MAEWYKINNAEELDSPALLVYHDRISDNIRLAREISKDSSLLRPHVKTHKMREIAKMMLEAGIRKFKCATIAEAEMLAMSGCADVLLAYQPTKVKALRLLELTAAYPEVRFSCLIDNIETAGMLSGVFKGQVLEVFIDLNTGMNRTGIAPEKAAALFQECRKLENILVAGLHAYDGHIRDTDPGKRTQRADETFRITQEALQSMDGGPLKVIMGGSPTFPIHARRKNVETSPGTFVFWDEGYGKALPDMPFTCAAVLLSRVVSIIDEQTLCLDLGHKSVAAENPLQQRVRFLNAPEAEMLSQSEEHLVVRVPRGEPHRIGDLWYGIPYHICPTVALYETAHVVKDRRLTEEWEILARKRKIRT
ncbi:D-serine deaminase-like pyridoxal phosphate-dependent protein [Anseongella ginsenosidimutans]|uniref:D-serine deaminase-like pyridoxal phosphate-dependent protein n=1 Tax=Anseongella ginsenosidimutans TaxID=496056 RepID=A0A4R3KU22_9SPHI|nr:D-TA family PLP-dependent enzyme [Anseongella ginsenosidimutans]QEC52913.1 D-TA family PLP-dependent enzyme [Anseongella ginsenosidimutans]TCS87305.1 D-serine deaminase-like pyridoxal phosphate-dependent protein [Anseongella ginsenosidimutans]